MKALLYILPLLVLSSCSSAVSNEPAGFFVGFLQGFVIILIWILSLFSDSFPLYESYNNGGWYDFGYFLGIMTMACNIKKRPKTIIVYK